MEDILLVGVGVVYISSAAAHQALVEQVAAEVLHLQQENLESFQPEVVVEEQVGLLLVQET